MDLFITTGLPCISSYSCLPTLNPPANSIFGGWSDHVKTVTSSPQGTKARSCTQVAGKPHRLRLKLLDGEAASEAFSNCRGNKQGAIPSAKGYAATAGYTVDLKGWS